MKEGKHQGEGRARVGKKTKIILMCTLAVIIISLGGVYVWKSMPNWSKINEKKETEKEKVEDIADIKATEKVEKLLNSKAPIIWYYDREDVKVQIKDGTLFRSYIKIDISRGNITVFTKDGKDFKEEYSPENKLSEGEYVIKVETEDGSSCERTFIIDTTPPKVTGIMNRATYQTARTIQFADINDVKEATLTKGKEIIDLKKESIKKEDGTASYEVKQNGEYTLKVKDIHGIEVNRKFTIKIE